MVNRRLTRVVKVGGVAVGGDNSVVVQSMTNTATTDIGATVEQIKQLQEAGCELVRVAVPDRSAAAALSSIKAAIDIPLIADIHFDYRLGLLAIEQGVDKLRINPGNIRGKKRTREIVLACKEAGIPLRIGVNSGSLGTEMLEKYGGPTPEAMVASALDFLDFFESLSFYDTIVSLKSSLVPATVESCRLFAEKTNYPLHLGITEAGSYPRGAIKTAVGLGGLLVDGIGDTIRVSLTGDPVREIEVAYAILQDSGRRLTHPDIITCPTCARTQINLEKIAAEVEKRLKGCSAPLRVAIMGCAVNGPGEAKEADIGIAAGEGEGLLFVRGEVVKKVPEDKLVATLIEEIEKLS
ncbi:MAG: flavodoxin-dependent (E)-4-hydroxy-3-methylbut-2-enyl-diphosphate synthase [bacterium]